MLLWLRRRKIRPRMSGTSTLFTRTLHRFRRLWPPCTIPCCHSFLVHHNHSLAEQFLKTAVTQALATEAVYRTEVRTRHPREPHVVHVLVQQTLHPAPGVDVAHIRIHDHLEEHPRMEAARAAALVSRLYIGDIKPVLLLR